MTTISHGTSAVSAVKTRNVFFVLAGIAVFLLKRQYAGPLEETVHAYAGNLSISFALYFVFLNLKLHARIKRLVAASLAFAIVELFEAFNGFGIMVNTYDPIDFIVNAIGVVLAVSVDRPLSPKAIKDAKVESPRSDLS
jgi:hypothetical protein